MHFLFKIYINMTFTLEYELVDLMNKSKLKIIVNGQGASHSGVK